MFFRSAGFDKSPQTCYKSRDYQKKEPIMDHYSNILFDLDGTLVDSGEGIIKCAQLALRQIGRAHV